MPINKGQNAYLTFKKCLSSERKEIEMKPMSEEEAILQMNLIGHDFFVFRNAKSGEIDVLYARKDGNYGIIETK